jgi:hypothetical protein
MTPDTGEGAMAKVCFMMAGLYALAAALAVATGDVRVMVLVGCCGVCLVLVSGDRNFLGWWG